MNHRRKTPVLWIPHIDGVSFRKLGNEYGLTGSQTYRRVVDEIEALPDNTWLTKEYCNRYSGILILDGKFIKVKGYAKKIPFIYGIDYLTHDIPVGVLAPSESIEAFRKLFRLLKTVSYPLRVVVCDDVLSALKPGLFYYYPKAYIQLCWVHYFENIRQLLHIRTQSDHQMFFCELKNIMHNGNLTRKQRNNMLRKLFLRRANKNIIRQQILIDIYNKEPALFSYVNIPHCPNNTNLSELFHSHLNPRLKSLKGFQSIHSAERFLNAWMIRRRTLPFTDCDMRFKHLNGKTALKMSMKKQIPYKEILVKYQPKMQR